MDDPNTTQIQRILTPYQPGIRSFRSPVGLVHPGVGLTEELLATVQKQVRGETEPWKTWFEDMLASETASQTPPIALTDPSAVSFSSKGTNSLFIRDALTAYTQAILYFVTGGVWYRRNVLAILRAWSQLNPEEFAYFPDAHIHVGIPMNRMCIAAEIIRYSSYETTGGCGDGEPDWTENEIADFCNYLLRPALRTFLSDCSGFMNQHLYTVIGAMSAYLFMDDMDGYAKTVEWFTVNRNGANPGFNGSIVRLFREITTADEVGYPEGSGRPLPEPVIQHVEMGRDQAHGCGDLTNAAILSRMMLGQKTKVDPVHGTISAGDDAVGIYEFAGDRILKAADFFFRYMLGYAGNWVQVPFSIRNGVIAENYTAFSPNYRGRYRTINFWDLYVYYTYCRPDVNLAEEYPYFYEGFMKKVPSVYYARGRKVVNWDNVDGGGDFWLFLPDAAAHDSRLTAKKQTDYRTEAEDRGSMVRNRSAMSVGEDNGVGYIRFARSAEESVLAMTDSGTDGSSLALHIRTDGMAKLTVSGVKGGILLPDTGGMWKYVICTRADSETFGDFYTITVSEIEGSYVDLDAVDIKPEETREERERIDILRFADGEDGISRIAYQNAPFTIDISTETSAARYEGIGLPEGAVLDASTGLLTWTPRSAGHYTFFISASVNQTVIVKKADVEVCADRDAALRKAAAGYDDRIQYTRASVQCFMAALEEARTTLETASDEAFTPLLTALCQAVGGLEPLSPLLADDPLTDGTSLDYPKMVYESTMGEEIHHLVDAEGTFCGYYKAVDRAHIMDFGAAYQLSVTRFGFQARPGFSDRLAGVQVFGSNDGTDWTLLTEQEASYTQQYHEVNVKLEERNSWYRYLKIRKTTEYPDALRGSIHGLLEFSVLRIYGIRRETEQ